jgi:hypothetical protein
MSKRSADTDGAAAAGGEQSAEKKAKIVQDTPAPRVFLLAATIFVDDYKSRGRDWSENITPRAFVTRETAEKALAKYLTDHMYREIAERFEREMPPFVTLKRWKFDGDGWALRTEYAGSLKAIEEEIAPFIEGENVEHRLTWAILETLIEA